MKMNVGQTIEIVYQDKAGKITQRKIEIMGIRDGRIRANCILMDHQECFWPLAYLLGSQCRRRIMLNNTARKLLMIMTHSSGHHLHMPTLQELETKSGRTTDKIREGMQELVGMMPEHKQRIVQEEREQG